MARKKTSMSFDEELLARVDAVRGDVPRSRWIERAIEARLEIHDRYFKGSGGGSILIQPNTRSGQQNNEPPLDWKPPDVEPNFKQAKGRGKKKESGDAS
jgi:hypothetical protein